MQINKLSPILCLAFQTNDIDPIHIEIDFGDGIVERDYLPKNAIVNLSTWEEVISITVEDARGKDCRMQKIERRWRERTL